MTAHKIVIFAAMLRTSGCAKGPAEVPGWRLEVDGELYNPGGWGFGTMSYSTAHREAQRIVNDRGESAELFVRHADVKVDNLVPRLSVAAFAEAFRRQDTETLRTYQRPRATEMNEALREQLAEDTERDAERDAEDESGRDAATSSAPLGSCATCSPRPCGEPPYRMTCRRHPGALNHGH